MSNTAKIIFVRAVVAAVAIFAGYEWAGKYVRLTTTQTILWFAVFIVWSVCDGLLSAIQKDVEK